MTDAGGWIFGFLAKIIIFRLIFLENARNESNKNCNLYSTVLERYSKKLSEFSDEPVLIKLCTLLKFIYVGYFL